MNAIKEVISYLITGGMDTAEAAALVALAVAEGNPKRRSSNAERQARYRDRKAAQTVTNRNAVTPEPDVTNRNENVTNRNNVTDDISILSLESKKDKPPKHKKRNALPSDFYLNERMSGYAFQKQWPREKIDFQFRKFCNFHSAKGSLMANWEAAWRNWVDNDYDGQRGSGQQGGFKWNGGIEGVI